MTPINPNIFNSDVEQIPIRSGFGEGLLEAGKNDVRVVALCADLTESTKVDAFKKAFPDRFVEMGIAEQSMASVASGMAAMGKIPFIASYAMFNPGRNWEQIRTTVCYNDVPVKVVGAHAGVSVGPDGGTHQAIEDIALMRIIPRMVVVVPCDAVEAKKATLAITTNNKPSYIRLAREKTPVVTTSDTPFEIGRAYAFYESQSLSDKKVGIIACGQMVYHSILAAKKLEEMGYQVGVLNMASVKPMDVDAVVGFAHKYGKLVTAEEHQVRGGMGSAVAEVLAAYRPTPIEFVGIKDVFGESGAPEELMEHFGLTSDGIVEAVKRLENR